MNSKIWFLCNRRTKHPHIEIYWFPLKIVWRGEGVVGRSFLDFSLETLKTPRIGTSHGELSLDLRPQNTHPHPHRLELLVENFREFDSVQTILCTGKLPSGYTQSRSVSRIWSRGGPASEAESCWCSEAESCKQSEQSVARVQGPLKGPGSFWVFNAQICILTHSRDSFSLIFDIYFDTKCW